MDRVEDLNQKVQLLAGVQKIPEKGRTAVVEHLCLALSFVAVPEAQRAVRQEMKHVVENRHLPPLVQHPIGLAAEAHLQLLVRS